MSNNTVIGPPFPTYVAGLDLGKVRDFTGLCVLERMDRGDRDAAGRTLHRYECRILKRSPLGVPYPALADRVAAALADPGLRPQREYEPDRRTRGVRVEAAPDPVLIVDATGVGSAVTDIILTKGIRATVYPLTITGGGQARADTWPGSNRKAFWVPKIELVGVVQALLSTGRLTIPDTLEHAETLKAELLSFEVRVTQSANETFGAWREGSHDDLVLALAMAAWHGEGGIRAPVVDRQLYAGFTDAKGRTTYRPVGPAEFAAINRRYRGRRPRGGMRFRP